MFSFQKEPGPICNLSGTSGTMCSLTATVRGMHYLRLIKKPATEIPQVLKIVETFVIQGRLKCGKGQSKEEAAKSWCRKLVFSHDYTSESPRIFF